MKSLPIASLALVLALSGCSTPTSESKPEYDELEVKSYEICLESHTNYLRQKYFNSVTDTTADMVEAAERTCERLKPVKR